MEDTLIQAIQRATANLDILSQAIENANWPLVLQCLYKMDELFGGPSETMETGGILTRIVMQHIIQQEGGIAALFQVGLENAGADEWHDEIMKRVHA